MGLVPITLTFYQKNPLTRQNTSHTMQEAETQISALLACVFTHFL